MAAEVPVLGALQGQVWHLEPLGMHWQQERSGMWGVPKSRELQPPPPRPRRPEGKQRHH